MSKKFTLSAVILLTAFIAACQPNPTLINSTVQPRDNRQPAATTHSETNRTTTHGDSTNHEAVNSAASNSNEANVGMANANSTNRQEMKRESRTNTGN